MSECPLNREYRKTATVMAHEATEGGVIHTLEGDHSYVAGDYVCTGVEGEHWPVRRSIFEATYVPAESPDRIAELEAHAEHDEDNLEGLQHALVRANQQHTQAEARIAELAAALEEQDRMLRLAYGHPEWDEHWYQGWFAALRARAGVDI